MIGLNFSEETMRYALLSTVAAAALSLSVAAVAQQMSPGGSAAGSGSGSGAGAATSGGTGGSAAGTGSGSGAGAATRSGPSDQGGQTRSGGQQQGQGPGQGQGPAQSQTQSQTGNITNEQRTQISQRFASVNVPTVSNVNFSVAVGTVIPETVTLVDVPPAIVEIVPAWRRYKVVKIRNQIIIVDPGPRRIVAVFDV